MELKWTYGENNWQKYYDVTVNGKYFVVFANNAQPHTWMACIDSQMIFDKTANDRERKKAGLDKNCDLSLLHSVTILSSNNPEYMMKKAMWCFKHGINEISK